MSIRTYVVDDSAVVRQALMHILQGDPEIELVGSAPNPFLLYTCPTPRDRTSSRTPSSA